MKFTYADVIQARIELFNRGLCPLTAKDIPPVLIPVFEGDADMRFSFGGRGGGKSWAFTKMAAVWGAIADAEGKTGVLLFIREFMNSLDDSSLQDLKNAIASDAWLSSVYEVGEKYVRTRSGRIKCIFSGTSVNLSSIKSKSKIMLCLAEEAENIDDAAWEKLIPTIREEGSECWAIWNPETTRSWVHRNLRMSNDPLIKGVEINWNQNPWFTSKMDRDRLRAKENDPDNYDHIWEGGFKTTFKGSYYNRLLKQAEQAGRITDLTVDPLMAVRAFWDIGGTGAKADATAIWIAQFVGEKIKVLDYYEAQGQDMATHVNWLRANDYGHAECYLPHDGAHGEKVFDTSYEKAMREAGFSVRVVPNQGKGAAMKRVEAGRRWLPRTWFDKERTQGGREALAAYHEKRDEERGIGLGPNHDWSSHGCLVAGTLIETRRGQIPIETVVAGDAVATPDGWAVIDWSGQTKISTDIVTVETEAGTIVMTPEHKVFTTRGVVRADALCQSDRLIGRSESSCLTGLVNAKRVGVRDAYIASFAGLGSGFGQNELFTQARQAAYYGFCTVRRLAMEFPKLCRSVVTGMTFPMPTGLFAPVTAGGKFGASAHIRHSWGKGTMRTSGDIFHEGIPRSRTCTESFGGIISEKSRMDTISITLTRTKATTALRTWNASLRAITRAFTRLTTHGLEAPKTRASFFPFKRKQANGTDLKPEGLGIVSMRREQDSVAVYDLTVRHDHCYFANGILVSNSDAAGLMWSCYEEPKSMGRIVLPKMAVA